MVNPQIPKVILLSGADNQLVRYTSALQQLKDANIGTHAIVGGFAVMLRLAAAHRVTEDLDTVAWTEDGTSDVPIRILMQQGATRSRNGVDLAIRTSTSLQSLTTTRSSCRTIQKKQCL